MAQSRFIQYVMTSSVVIDIKHFSALKETYYRQPSLFLKLSQLIINNNAYTV